MHPWLRHYDAGVPRSLEPYPDRTLLDYLDDAVAAQPEAPAILFKGPSHPYDEAGGGRPGGFPTSLRQGVRTTVIPVRSAMKSSSPVLVLAMLMFVCAAHTAAQAHPPGCPAGSKPILSAPLERSEATAVLCTDGTSNTIMLSERISAPARLHGCPSDTRNRGMGSAMAIARARAGGTELVLLSRDHPGCSATAMFAALPTLTVEETTAWPEPDTRRVAARTRVAFSRFWRNLPRAEAAALERRLSELEARVHRGGNVDRELSAIRNQYPHLADLAVALQREPWHMGSSDGAAAGTAQCDGFGWIRMDGRVRCVGVLRIRR